MAAPVAWAAIRTVDAFGAGAPRTGPRADAYSKSAKYSGWFTLASIVKPVIDELIVWGT